MTSSHITYLVGQEAHMLLISTVGPVQDDEALCWKAALRGNEAGNGSTSSANHVCRDVSDEIFRAVLQPGSGMATIFGTGSSHIGALAKLRASNAAYHDIW